jgi:tryptophan halogenase
MTQQPISRVVIVGGGTAGWMTAAALARFLEGTGTSIHLIESELIGTVGVGEATIPAIHDFNNKLGLDEREFMRSTSATFKLGIEFVDWTRIGDAYMHPFGTFGQDLNGVGFHHYWRSLRQLGDDSDIGEYCLAQTAAKLGRFALPQSDPQSIYSTYAYAFHFDAGKYAVFLRNYAEQRGVVRTEGRVVDVNIDSNSGFIDTVVLEDREVIKGDFFIDCSGFRGLLIEQALHTGYEDWSHWLPCDRAVAMPSEHVRSPRPYTRATALQAGWQWHIPLQHRTGNGLVYCSQHLSDDEAVSMLRSKIEGEPLADPNLLRFTTGRRTKTWNRNCVAIGLSGGFLEPLESTSIWLIQAAIIELLQTFPDRGFAAVDIDNFNQVMASRFEQVRDFLILHYYRVDRDDSDFWNACKTMSIPDSLAYRIDLFEKRGHVVFGSDELFIEGNWLSVLLGQNVIPQTWDPRVECIAKDELQKRMGLMKSMVRNAAEMMPRHAETLGAHCGEGEAIIG